MRLWSLHPSYLDAVGLVALWREGLLAQKVLMGLTQGYRHHPQLDRFKKHPDPVAAIGFYLRKVYEEAVNRGYNFDQGKIMACAQEIDLINLLHGQLAFEARHLSEKLRKRDPLRHKSMRLDQGICQHPLFNVIDGDMADWEKGS
ncbi:MAG: pyrimidine dimer DNA glycosylase/endonuclease V [Candidatus Omnitrophota bacterium]